jgi:hypothetical protein
MLGTRFVLSLVALAVAAAPSVLAQKLKPEELVKQHVERTFGASTASPGREVRGTCHMTTTTMGAGWLDGPFTLSSASDASKFVLRFNQEVYEGEEFGIDGKEVTVAFAQPRTSMRSAMGLFLSLNRVVIRDGLFGGVLNRRWPLLDVAAREAKLSYDGIKKFEGADLHRVRYRARRDQADLSILLHFEPETLRHMATVYESSRAQGMGLTIEQSSQLTEQRFRLQESFSDFEPRDGLTLPKSWVVRYARTGDSTTEWKYECKVQSTTAGGAVQGH